MRHAQAPRPRPSLLAPAIALCVMPVQGALAQQVPAILSDPDVRAEHYLPDFSYAGYEFGNAPIPEVAVTIAVADHGAIPDDGIDDSVAIRKALAAAHAMDGPVRVTFESGRYLLTEILWIERSGIVLSGMGSGRQGTQLYMPRPLNQIDDGGALTEIREYLRVENKYERQPDVNLDVIFSEYSWSGGFIWTRAPGARHATYLERYDRPIEELGDIREGARGERMVEIASTDALAVGDVLQIHWHNRAGENGPLIAEMYGETDLKIGDRHWELPDRPLVRQATRIEAIDGTRVTIADPLMLNISADVPANFAKWNHISDVGIENLALTFPENPYFGHHNEAGYNGVYFTGVHNGWIRNVRVTNADAGILTDDLANVTIANVVTDGTHKAHYAVHVGNVHNVLIDGLDIFNPTEHSLTFNTQSTKSVYRDAEVWTTPTLDQHAGANHQNLYDNVTVHVVPNETAADGTPLYDLFKAGGAGYWQPGHGRYSTIWNLDIRVEGGVEPNSPIAIVGRSEGPEARVIGVHGNRPIRFEYDPAPYTEMMGQRIAGVPSLYDAQLAERRAKEE